MATIRTHLNATDKHRAPSEHLRRVKSPLRIAKYRLGNAVPSFIFGRDTWPVTVPSEYDVIPLTAQHRVTRQTQQVTTGHNESPQVTTNPTSFLASRCISRAVGPTSCGEAHHKKMKSRPLRRVAVEVVATTDSPVGHDECAPDTTTPSTLPTDGTGSQSPATVMEPVESPSPGSLLPSTSNLATGHDPARPRSKASEVCAVQAEPMGASCELLTGRHQPAEDCTGKMLLQAARQQQQLS